MTAGTGVAAYADDLEHLDDELGRLDLLIRSRAATLRAQLHPESQVERAVYVTDDEVARLLVSDGPAPRDRGTDAAVEDLTGRIEARLGRNRSDGPMLRLPTLGRALGLSDLELRVVVVVLAPELRRKYDRLYAYLQDDITRQRPSTDLVLELLCDGERDRWRARSLFADAARLRRTGVLETVDDPGSPSGSSGLARFLHLDARIVQFLLGGDDVDSRLAGRARLYRPSGEEPTPDVEPALLARLDRLLEARLAAPGDGAPVVHLHGPSGVGKRDLARYACARLGAGLLEVDAEALVAGPVEEAAATVRLVLREGALQQCPVYVQGVEALTEPRGRPVLTALAEGLTELPLLLFTAGGSPWRDVGMLGGARITSIEVPVTPVTVRERAWQRELAELHPHPPDWPASLAARYRLGPARIRAAARAAADLALLRGEGGGYTFDDVTAACRTQSDHRLGDLAVKVDLRHGWEHLVLPVDRTAVLGEMCAQVRHRHRVYDTWGFGERLGNGIGLTALFTGPPGTGKSLAAQVVARDVGLELYRVDLSRVVSKYIGETEKNLARIFAEAATSNAVLFFDEADALFARRTEVSDAHDRYANIETGYLLQQLDDHDGVVILATNLRQNLDEAFTRRIRFLVDFPFPDEEHRRRIWGSHLPPEAPVATDVDCAYLARSFPLAGGNIRNVVLNAAFLAAAADRPISARHLVQATRREFDKVGKVWSEPR